MKRTIRSSGGKIIRKFGLTPAGTPDRNGQDAELKGAAWPYEVMVYFADTQEALYQIEQWYDTFVALNEAHKTVVVCMDSRTAAVIREATGLDVFTIAHYTTIDSILSQSPAMKVCLYVNHNPENFSNLRFGQLVHASLMHGDSDKLVTVSNQTKAYDFSFVAGQAAVDRMAKYSTLYDAHEKCIPVGRPQVDGQLERSHARESSDARTTVLYAPSWEGGQPTAAYGSIESHGVALVDALLSSDRYAVIYRPHPLTGVRVASYGQADAEIRKLLEEANVRAGETVHRVDSSGDVAYSFADADIMICDISGVAMDWLPSKKPLIITVPVEETAIVAQSPLTELAPRLNVADMETVLELVDEHLDNDPTRDERIKLAEYYLGDLTPGASTQRFIDAVERLIEIRDKEMARIASYS
ncbi:CDP-glycerol glycerophosphotransferase family protein [Timonella sp. A28]|uniref:CDP-glycerol glycerophosphotransferase family protein n=1 Tax=Timonella sp. A28 TaxID=3442640 RepID=UPI003EBC0840